MAERVDRDRCGRHPGPGKGGSSARAGARGGGRSGTPPGGRERGGSPPASLLQGKRDGGGAFAVFLCGWHSGGGCCRPAAGTGAYRVTVPQPHEKKLSEAADCNGRSTVRRGLPSAVSCIGAGSHLFTWGELSYSGTHSCRPVWAGAGGASAPGAQRSGAPSVSIDSTRLSIALWHVTCKVGPPPDEDRPRHVWVVQSGRCWRWRVKGGGTQGEELGERRHVSRGLLGS